VPTLTEAGVFALVVELYVRPDKRQQFLRAIEANATASVRDEPGCFRFDVVQDRDDPDHFFLYEVYTDEAAFEAHRSAPHFPVWRAAAATCLRADDGQRNVPCNVVFSGHDA
jgi:(4S)-4-hydroxy-5-phosphonooxypentane-2,3-dione isomerase